MKRPIGVLVSGAGSNLQALCDAARNPDFPAVVALVVCNRADAGAIDVARRNAVPVEVFPLADFAGNTLARDHAMRDALRAKAVDLVVCAGYNRVLSDDFLMAFPDAILNVHPSLLPAFGGGMHAIEDALAAGARVTGATVHYLEPGETDGGAIVVQGAVDILTDDTVDSLRTRVHDVEWRILPEAVGLWCQGRLRRHGRRIEIVSSDKNEVRTS